MARTFRQPLLIVTPVHHARESQPFTRVSVPFGAGGEYRQLRKHWWRAIGALFRNAEGSACILFTIKSRLIERRRRMMLSATLRAHIQLIASSLR